MVRDLTPRIAALVFAAVILLAMAYSSYKGEAADSFRDDRPTCDNPEIVWGYYVCMDDIDYEVLPY